MITTHDIKGVGNTAGTLNEVIIRNAAGNIIFHVKVSDDGSIIRMAHLPTMEMTIDYLKS